MAKIFGFVPLELRPGVNEQDFFKFWNEEYAPLGERLGWKGYALKADRGEKNGKIAVIWEIPSVEHRNRVIPDNGQTTEEALKLLNPEFDEANKKLDAFVVDWPFTDYIVQE